MKRKYILSAALLLLTITGAEATSYKRGVSENQFQALAQMEALAPGVSWYYTWGNTPGSKFEDFDGMDFVPMAWNGNYNADRIREYCKTHPQTKYILGFNEPNFKAQANMTPREAADQWPALQALANELGLKIVAPALNYSPDAPYYDPASWMDEFVNLVGTDAFDYVAIHNYGGFGVMESLASRFHEKYGKPVWVTEFCYWPEEGNANSTVSPTAQIASMVETLEWLEKTEWIYRYAWFKAIGNSSASKGPNYGLLLSGKGEEKRELSDQGAVYVYMSEFNPDCRNAVGDLVAATEYLTQSKCALGKTSGTNPDFHPIEISAFSAGATADYQFDVDTEGDYTLVMKVSGCGEPKRFDPAIGIYLLNGEKESLLDEDKAMTLPGADEIYENKYFNFHLESGRQTLRIKDLNPYMPSGIRIQSLMLARTEDVDQSGIDEVALGLGLVNVYNLQGVLLLKNANRADLDELLSSGIYIIDGKKVVVN